MAEHTTVSHENTAHDHVPVKYAGFWVRLAASAVDAMIFGVISYSIQTLLGHNPFAALEATTIEEVTKIQAELNGPQNLFISLFSAFLIILFWVHYEGATPGKKLMGLKVTKAGGDPLTYVTGIIRYFGYFLSSVVLGLGYIWISWDAKKQGWHDKIASTVVIYNPKEKGNPGLGIFLAILYIVGIIVLFSAMGYKGYTLATEEGKKENPEYRQKSAEQLNAANIKEDADRILSFAPSVCGLSVPVPKTTDTTEGVTRKWLYEEIPLDGSSFYALDTDVFAPEEVIAAVIGYKNETKRLGANEDGLVFINAPGINIICADNTRKLSLEEYKSLALTSKTYKVETQNMTYWGEVAVYPVTVSGTGASGTPFKDIAYLGVSKDNSKLLYMRIWGIGDTDPQATQFDKDIDLIVRDMQYRDSNGTGKSDQDPQIKENVQGASTKFFDTGKIK